MNPKALTPEQTTTAVYALIEERLGVRGGEIAPDKELVKDLGADSLDSVELIMSLEQQFDISIPDTDTEHIKTVGDILNYINTHNEK